MTRILVVHFSQSGQLTRVARSMLEPLAQDPAVRLDWCELLPDTQYPFPWPFMTFFDTFPEAVYLDAPPVRTSIVADGDYDLIVLAYQVWFLAPSLPVSAFLQSGHAQVLRGRRVITLVACRNMWTTAHRTVQALLQKAGARQTDNVVLTDNGPFWSTFITTPWWLLTGNPAPLPALLPRAGISERDIAGAARFGRALREALPAIARGESGPFLSGLQAVRVNRLTMLAERIGQRSFRIWGRLIRAAGPRGSVLRRPIVAVYVLFLVTIILTVLPISMSIAALLARISPRVRRQAAELEAPSGSSSERLSRFSGA